MLSLKPGVRIAGMRPEILFAVIVAEHAYTEAGFDLTITACVDGKHSAGSLHYSGAAIDIQTRDIPAEALQKIVARIKGALGADFDVVMEADHLHIEFQPKQAVNV